MSLISRILPYAVAVLIALAAGLYIHHLTGRMDALAVQLKTAQAVNAANVQEMAQLKATATISMKAVSDNAAQTVARTQSVAAIKREIFNAKPQSGTQSGNCTTVGPQLRAALDGLRQLQRAGADPR